MQSEIRFEPGVSEPKLVEVEGLLNEDVWELSNFNTIQKGKTRDFTREEYRVLMKSSSSTISG